MLSLLSLSLSLSLSLMKYLYYILALYLLLALDYLLELGSVNLIFDFIKQVECDTIYIREGPLICYGQILY